MNTIFTFKMNNFLPIPKECHKGGGWTSTCEGPPKKPMQGVGCQFLKPNKEK
jgi:hypothetical protein